jgi:NDP-sugar pyrophosphorylase family protein
MKAMLFAAGLGTRLRPLTNDKPKALVEVKGVPLLEIAIRRLIHAGCREVIVNVHHFAGQVIEFLERKNHFGIHVAISHEEDSLLDTGGGLKKAAWFFNKKEPFLVCNADVLTNLDLRKFYEVHLRSHTIATLAIRHRKTSRYFLFDKNLCLQGWQNAKTGEVRTCSNAECGIRNVEFEDPGSAFPPGDSTFRIPYSAFEQWAFSGIHVISPEIFEWMPSQDVFSIIDVYLKVAGHVPVKGFPHDEDFWMDVGKPAELEKAEQLAATFLAGIL